MQRIIKGDNVKVIAGKNRGAVGMVLKVFPKTNRVLIEKVNIVKRHLKDKNNTQGGESGVIEKEGPLSLSNVALVDPKSKNKDTVKVSYIFDAKGKKVRGNRKTGLPIKDKK